MVAKNSIDLSNIISTYQAKTASVKQRIVICAGTGCVASGSFKIYSKFQSELQSKGHDVTVDLKYEDPNFKSSEYRLTKSGCQGFCQKGPLVAIEPMGVLYTHVSVDDVSEIVNDTVLNGKLINRLLCQDPQTHECYKGMKEIPFYTRQNRTVLYQCGKVDPEDVNEYIANGGYAAASKVYLNMEPKDVCKTILDSGIRGRGGGGFPTGKKWELTLVQPGEKKYVVCNGDEGDPGAFMDRSLMEGNPHSVIEGMMIAGRGIGADEGYVYVRAEYPLAVERMRKAVQAARDQGILGKNVLGSKYSFDIEVMEGAGAFVCGEETALLASIEGERGMPRSKPPFPAQSGLFGKPTVINNVETLATIARIINNGAEEYRKVGTKSSPGTKTFALTGHVANTGLIEVPFGATIRNIVFDVGGGVTDNEGNPMPDGFKAVQIGGPSGGCLTEEHLDLPMDFDSLRSIGAMVGSGGLVVMNKNTCMVQIARFFMQFTQNESCGKCVLCREGTKQMLHLLDDIINGVATKETIDTLQQLTAAVSKGSLCGLGKTAPNPVMSMLRFFREEIEEHVYMKKCRTRQCKNLCPPTIDPSKCIGCKLCAKKCPVGAIVGEKKMPHKILDQKCIKCGVCIETCKFHAIS